LSWGSGCRVFGHAPCSRPAQDFRSRVADLPPAWFCCRWNFDSAAWPHSILPVFASCCCLGNPRAVSPAPSRSGFRFGCRWVRAPVKSDSRLGSRFSVFAAESCCTLIRFRFSSCLRVRWCSLHLVSILSQVCCLVAICRDVGCS
jgi:hypothetical protein